jgi:DNA polymerase III delta prime subunit
MRSVNNVRHQPKTFETAMQWARHFMYGGVEMEDFLDGRGKRRVIFIDEAQVMPPRLQEKVKLWIEHEEVDARFVLATNNPEKLRSGLQSRLMTFDFSPTRTELPLLIEEAINRFHELLLPIAPRLTGADIEVVMQGYFPDLRRATIELLRLSFGRLEN